MKALRALVVMVMIFGLTQSVWAVTQNITVSATVPEVETLTFEASPATGSAGNANSVIFDTVDINDPGLTQADGPSPDFMYAPIRSVANAGTGQNWHVARINSNAPNGFTLDVASISDPELDAALYTFCGGFFHDQFGDSGGKSGDWELLSTFSRDFPNPFAGIATFNYRLNLQDLPGAGSFAGDVVWRLVNNP